MIQPKDFRYTLVADDETLTLTHHPIGWNEYSTEWGVERKHFGTGRKLVVELRFVKEGAAFLRRQYANHGVSARVKLLIDKLDRSTYEYHLDFEGDFSFSLINDMRHRDADYVSIQLFEAGIYLDLKANEKVTYELDLPATVTIDKTANALNTATWVKEYKKGDTIYHYGANLQQYEITSNRIEVKTPEAGRGKFDWMLKVSPGSEPIASPKIKVRYKLTDIGTKIGVLYLSRFYTLPEDPDTRHEEANELIFDFRPPEAQEGRLEGEVTVAAFPEPIGSGKTWYLNIGDTINRIPLNDEDRPHQAQTNVELTIEMSVLAEPIVEPFSFSAVRLFDVGTQLLHNINPAYTFESDLLNSDSILSTTFAASGDAIRGIPEAKLKTSWLDFLQGIGGIRSYSMQIDTAKKVVRLRSIEHAFQADREIADLGKASSLSIKPFEEFIFSQVKAGTKDPEYKLVNGRFEFNNEVQLKTNITAFTNEKSFISKYRTDSFGVTAIKYEAVKSETTDDKSDNDVFLIHCDSLSNPKPYTEHVIVGDDTQLQRTGVFNVGLTPVRCLIRQASLLLSGLHKQPKVLRWLTSSKTSATLESRFKDPVTGVYDHVVEKADVKLEGTPLFIPKKVTLTCCIPQSLPELMAKNVGGYLSFTWRGKRYKGFPLLVGQKPKTNKEQEVTLLLHPETDMP